MFTTNAYDYYYHMEYNYILEHNDFSWEIRDSDVANFTALGYMWSPYPLDGHPPHIGHEWLFDAADGSLTKIFNVTSKCVSGNLHI